MPVTLATPIVKHTVKQQAIKEIIMPFTYRTETSGEMRIDGSVFQLRCDIGNYGDTPEKLEKEKSMMVPWSAIPPAGQDALKSLYQWLESKAMADGWIQPGTITDPEPTEIP